jgi:hypothetical protein
MASGPLRRARAITGRGIHGGRRSPPGHRGETVGAGARVAFRPGHAVAGRGRAGRRLGTAHHGRFAEPGYPGRRCGRQAENSDIRGGRRESCPQTADHGYVRKGFVSDWRIRGSGGPAPTAARARSWPFRCPARAVRRSARSMWTGHATVVNGWMPADSGSGRGSSIGTHGHARHRLRTRPRRRSPRCIRPSGVLYHRLTADRLRSDGRSINRTYD